MCQFTQSGRISSQRAWIDRTTNSIMRRLHRERVAKRRREFERRSAASKKGWETRRKKEAR